ncbi:DNA-binding NarL/FixJ family response regulator [Povalibacter uvarum]|uniref:DNA-binding NarL/FixJ family response regulator n=1 Tax=Povalibacter uvarum TaxID=732238 RepID=A0A841HFP6_9GAMM|nr:hypothetical protein [Povalibacter uvarum]MBB6091269.1 DNA-binding NarL/FixJ family response regulator [Povalibacter uvarum]
MNEMIILIAQSSRLDAFRAAVELELDGHTVVGPTSSSGEAIVLARSRRPALALIDIDLETEGAGARLARQLQSELSVPVILATSDEKRARHHADCALGRLLQPFDETELPSVMHFASAVIRGEVRENPVTHAFELYAD